MKQIKKLSTKLLLALGVIILGVIVWQVIVSERVIGDIHKISKIKSIEQAHELLKTGELKTYTLVPRVPPFSRIRLVGVSAYILKGDEYAVYVSDSYKRDFEIRLHAEAGLFMSAQVNEFSESAQDLPVFIVMPEDPQFVGIIQPAGTRAFQHRIYGFSGENTLLSIEDDGCKDIIYTDMPYINVNQKNSYLELHVSNRMPNRFSSSEFSSSELNRRIGNVQLNVYAENARLLLEDKSSDSINVNIELQNSCVQRLKIDSESKLGTLNLHGVLGNTSEKTMEIIYPGQCDSLMLRLTYPFEFERTRKMSLSENLSGRFEDIEVSDNIIIEKNNK